MKINNIRFMPDYGCWSLWDMDNFGDISPHELPITEHLQHKIESWTKNFDDTLDVDNPIDSGFNIELDEKLFAEEGWLIFKELKKQLPSINIVTKGGVFEKFPDSSEFKEGK